jgi:protein-tyrosine-phosphatase
MTGRPYTVLFLCTGNSARSIIAECVLNRLGGGRFVAHSAGSHPRGAVHPETRELLRSLDYPTGGLRSKSWDEFAGAGGPRFDFVFTVCDDAAGDACPVWPGQPVTAHWGLPDPAAVAGSAAERRAAFEAAYRGLHDRILQLVGLPIAELDRRSLQRRLDEIGRPSSVAS